MADLVIHPYDLSQGFCDVVVAWSQYLSRWCDGDWQTPGCVRFFEAVGSDVPTRPITQDELEAMVAIRALVTEMRKLSNRKNLPANKIKLDTLITGVASYLKDECSMVLDQSVNPINAIENCCDSLETAVSVVKSEYTSAPSSVRIADSVYLRLPPPVSGYDFLEPRDTLADDVVADAATLAGVPVSAVPDEAPLTPTDAASEYGVVPPEIFPDRGV
ncbi:MAG: hypothetical protein ABSC95_28625 [Acetobacteraceae bacterium]|jgi:hypothetical protein